MWIENRSQCLLPVLVLALLGACTPRVEVAVPDKPITININLKIKHEIIVKIDQQLDKLLSEDTGLF